MWRWLVVEAASVASVRRSGSYGAGSWAIRHGPTIDLFNVSLRQGKVVAYGPLSQESRDALSAVSFKLEAKMVASQPHLPTVPIVETTNEGTCGRATMHVFFVSPWDWSNAWHFANDAISLAHHLQTTPFRQEPAALRVFESPKKKKSPISLAAIVVRALFGTNVGDASRMLKQRSTPCLNVHWGVGARLIGPVDGGGFVEERRAAADALRDAVLKECGGGPGTSFSTRALFVERSCGGNGASAARCLSKPATARLRAAFKERGVDLEPCCDDWTDACGVVRRFSAADLVVGMHGAGLANALFAPNHFVLVELHGGYGASLDLFRKISQARRGGYVSVATQGGGGAEERGASLDANRSTRVAACAVALWEQQDSGATGKLAALGHRAPRDHETPARFS
ncbi:hypothetical protein CTAYLR_007174 [Chrysophaeum taylorii]|uniref:Glycosyltransferase family 61 protein n=1 Tax=Chrysophaeum taylorii TaxID=2483200 RepID=A0AAD7XLZ1_9STRA|nr:hypothetical protein CTAYLR_007174 [Chrysophaeum taylorii]